MLVTLNCLHRRQDDFLCCFTVNYRDMTVTRHFSLKQWTSICTLMLFLKIFFRNKTVVGTRHGHCIFTDSNGSSTPQLQLANVYNIHNRSYKEGKEYAVQNVVSHNIVNYFKAKAF